MLDEEGHILILHQIKICMLDVEGHRLILHPFKMSLFYEEDID